MSLTPEQLDQLMANLAQDERWKTIPVNISEQAINDIRENICREILQEHMKKFEKPRGGRRRKKAEQTEQ